MRSFTSVVEELAWRGLRRQRIFPLSTMSKNQLKKATSIFAREDPASRETVMTPNASYKQTRGLGRMEI